MNMKPSRRPMTWPSTMTSPVLLISVSSPVFSRSRRISTLVRRSTKRSVSRSCSASESLSSTARVIALPMLGIGEPVRTVGREGPGPDMRDAVRQRVDVAVGVVRLLDLAGEPVDRDRAFPHQETIERGGELGVVGGRDLPVVGNLADLPQPLDRRRAWLRARGCRRRARRAPAPGCPRRSARG